MALKPNNAQHQKQIEAGIIGRKRGHLYESQLAEAINEVGCRYDNKSIDNKNLFKNEEPTHYLLSYIIQSKGWNRASINSIKAWWLGGLATANAGDLVIDSNGERVKKSKSDILIEFGFQNEIKRIGVSVKTCFRSHPTNAQMYFTTASAFCDLLEENGISVSQVARNGLRAFCGDKGFRPMDVMSQNTLENRLSAKERFYWEEIGFEALADWNIIFRMHQSAITKILFQKSYSYDPFPPDYLFHLTCNPLNFKTSTFAIYSIDEIVEYSVQYSGFSCHKYRIKKGRYKGDPNEHEAPFFGFIQFQRGGQAQHPTQLQFNLKSGYFNFT